MNQVDELYYGGKQSNQKKVQAVHVEPVLIEEKMIDVCMFFC